MEQSLESKLANVDTRSNTWHQPEEFDLRDPSDRRILERKFDSNQVSNVHDALENIAEDLSKVEEPGQDDGEVRLSQHYQDIVGKGPEYGRWFYFPWSQELVHFPPIDDHRRLRTARNRNLITAEEQQALYASSLAIFGMSVGSNVVEKLVLSGIGGKLILADPDAIEPTNLNRINGSFTDVGSKKVDYVARKISEVDPYIEQVHIKERVDSGTLAEITSTHRPDVLIDEVDDLAAKVAIRQAGSASAKPVLMATDLGDKSIIDIERHDLKQTKPFNGRLKDSQVQAILEGSDPEAIKKALPKIIGIKNVTPRLLDSFMEQGKTLAGIPQLGMTASMGGSLAALATREIILGRKLDSGRYIFSPKEMLDLDSPTPLLVGVRTLYRFAKNAKTPTPLSVRVRNLLKR